MISILRPCSCFLTAKHVKKPGVQVSGEKVSHDTISVQGAKNGKLINVVKLRCMYCGKVKPLDS